MWPYYLALALTSLCLWLLLISSNRTANPISNTSIELNIVAAQNSQKNASALAKSAKRKIHIPKFMLDLYEERKRDGGYPFNFSKPDIVRSVIPKNGGTLLNNNVLESFEENHLLIFDVPSSGDDETFLSAELRILTLINVAAGLNGVERVLKLSLYDDSSKNFHRLSDFHLFHKNNTWLKFNLTVPVQELLAKTSKKKLLKLVISVRLFFPVDFKPNLFKLSLLPSTEDLEHDYPILLLSYMSLKKKMGSAKRTKRNVEDDYEEDTNKLWDNDLQNKAQSKKTKRLRNTCKRKHLYVDFAEIHYDTWIVQPSGYEAYQCTGKCFYPVADHLSPTKHAIVQALLHSVAPSRAPRSCCVPSKLEPISLLYVDEKGVLTYRFGYNDMVVTECGCR